VRSGQVPNLKLNANLMKLAHFNDLGPAKNVSRKIKLILQAVSQRAFYAGCGLCDCP
jgi:hypothetical protein